MKATGMAFWACRPCTAYSQGITRKIRQVETRVEQIAASVEEVKDNVKENKQEMTTISEKVKKVEETVSKMAETSSDFVFQELREREARRLNLVLYGVQECNLGGATGKDRQKWDIDQAVKICGALDLNYDSDTFKFCRRVGPTGEGPRPVVLGFFTEMEKSMVMRRAKRLLESADYSEVSVTQDLTNKQRKEERELWTQAEERNQNRSEAELQKNLEWAVVGARGEKRLILQTSRPPPNNNNSGVRGRRGRGQRAWRPQQGRGRPLTGGNTQPQGPRVGQPTRPIGQEEEMPLEVEDLEEEREEGETATQPPAGRITTKRKAAAAAEGQPLDKRQ